VTLHAGSCIVDAACPDMCRCEGALVDCSERGLGHLPPELPSFTAELLVQRNQINKLTKSALFGKLTNLRKLDLSFNMIATVEAGAFENAEGLQEL